MGKDKMIYEKISNVQSRLKAPKSQFNKFGKYKYRNQEDILEALKPLLAEEGLVQFLSDDIERHGDRYYIRATVTVTDGEREVMVSALARESESKKGMDESQITGTASSYARKYALNGMWNIDDTKDADTQPKAKPQLTPKHKNWIKAAVSVADQTTTIDKIKDYYDISDKNVDLLLAEVRQMTEG
jgi:hypothetical protein